MTLSCVYESETPLKTCSFKQSVREIKFRCHCLRCSLQRGHGAISPLLTALLTLMPMLLYTPGLQGQDWRIRREGAFSLSLWTLLYLWHDEGQLFLACKDSGANFHTFIQRAKWKYWTWKVPVWGGLRYEHNTERYTILGKGARTNGQWLLGVSSCSLKKHWRWGMTDSKWVKIPESERHDLEASKTAAASERWPQIRQDRLY